jgi:hypothetical protein
VVDLRASSKAASRAKLPESGWPGRRAPARHDLFAQHGQDARIDRAVVHRHRKHACTFYATETRIAVGAAREGIGAPIMIMHHSAAVSESSHTHTEGSSQSGECPFGKLGRRGRRPGGVPREEHPLALPAPAPAILASRNARHPSAQHSGRSDSRRAGLCRGKLHERGFPSPHIQFT